MAEPVSYNVVIVENTSSMMKMLEVEMYEPFENWLMNNSDMFMQEPLIPAIACFDFIAFNSGLLIAYELKLNMQNV